MLVGGVGATGRAGASVARKGGAGVRVTGRGWVRVGGTGPEVGEEGSRPGGRDAESSGSEVGEGDEDKYEGISGLAVEAGRGSCSVVSTQIATLEFKVEN